MKKIHKIAGLFFLILFIFVPFFSEARTNVTDWYIQNFESEIEVRENSTLLITEKITADCGNAPDKHGIFRVLPIQLKTPQKTIQMPVKLISITDFFGKNIPYSEIENSNDKTVTWKIGDKDKTVTGVNEYKIVYEVGNVINFDNSQWDELYWNLNGNFWDLETDQFSAKIIFPTGISEKNAKVENYTGDLGEKNKNTVHEWTSENVLFVISPKSLKKNEGITLSVTFPKNIITPYEFSFWEKNKKQVFFSLGMLIFLFSFMVAFSIWKKYGKDPRMDKTIIAEFEAPEKLTPLEMGVLMSSGGFKNEYITASIINLAVRGVIKIEEIEKDLLEEFSMIGQKNIRLTLVDQKKLEESDPIEKKLIQKMLSGGKSIDAYSLIKSINETVSQIKKDGDANLSGKELVNKIKKTFSEKIIRGNNSVKLSSLKTEAFKIIKEIKEDAVSDLVYKKLINKKGLTFKGVFLALFVVFVMLTFFFIQQFVSIGLVLSALVFLVFSFIMPQRTSQGAEAYWKIKGFKLYMETAEKYRQQFYEKENIFEKLLPYAIVFGMAKLWAKKMEEIYGQDYFKNYHPVWYAGLGSDLSSFDAGSFTDSLNSISSSINSNISSGSGAGGGGGSGGGGGGGGGGGW